MKREKLELMSETINVLRALVWEVTPEELAELLERHGPDRYDCAVAQGELARLLTEHGVERPTPPLIF